MHSLYWIQFFVDGKRMSLNSVPVERAFYIYLHTFCTSQALFRVNFDNVFSM